MVVDPAELGAQLRRRRAAAAQCAPLDCGHPAEHRDPLECLAFEARTAPLTDHQLDGWQFTAGHLARTGHPGILPDDVVEALLARDSRSVVTDFEHYATSAEVGLPACTGAAP
jgi:hypothetical protein